MGRLRLQLTCRFLRGGKETVIKKYSQLNIYKLPPRSEWKADPEGFRNRIREVVKARKELILRKLTPSGGKVPATGDPFNFYIVLPYREDKTKWRVTYFKIENKEEVPVGHTVCDSLIRTETSRNSVEEYLSGVDWERWSKE